MSTRILEMDFESDDHNITTSSPMNSSRESAEYIHQTHTGRWKKIIIGCIIVVLLAFSWVGAQQLAQNAVQLANFDAPYFISWLATCWMVLCYPLYTISISLRYRNTAMVKRAINESNIVLGSPRVTVAQFFKKILPMNVLWVATNYLYLIGLKFIAATDASAIFASNVAFVYILSLCILGDKIFIIRILACLFCISGVVLCAYSYGFYGGSKFFGGAFMAVAAAFGAALYKVVFKLWVGEATLGQVSLFLSLLGVCNIIFMWPIVLILYFTGAEHFRGSNIPWVDLTSSNILGLIFNFVLNFGVAYTYPLFISIAMMLGIPLNAAFDIAIKGVAFNVPRMIAACIIILGFCMMLLPEHLNKPIHDVILCKFPNGSGPVATPTSMDQQDDVFGANERSHLLQDE